jgi:hypothetical protein
VDPHAGPPTLLAVDGDQGLLLDDHARIRRLFEAAHDATVVCPGGQRFASVLGSRVVVRGLDGRARWTQRIPPAAGTDQVACLDPDGRRVVVSRGMDAMKSVHLVTRRADRRILRGPNRYSLLDLTTGTVLPIDGAPADWLAPDRLVVTTSDEVRVLDLTGQVQQRWSAHTDEVMVDDGTIIAMKGLHLRVLREGPGNTFRGGKLERTVWVIGAVG